MIKSTQKGDANYFPHPQLIPKVDAQHMSWIKGFSVKD